jgi:DNA mismatch endonuclease (patch repair protein)
MIMEAVRTNPKRSALMSRVRQKGTASELLVRQALYAIGGRFRVNRRALPGSPDISSTRRLKAIFVNGCFWHGHRGCARSSVPKTNRDFWCAKLAGNVERDARKVAELELLRFEVLTIWECELEEARLLRDRLKKFWFRPQRKLFP